MNKLKNEQEIKLILSVIINNYCAELNDSYGESWEDVEAEFTNELYKTLADEIASAGEVERNKVKEYLKEHSITARITIPDTYVVNAEELMEKLKNEPTRI